MQFDVVMLDLGAVGRVRKSCCMCVSMTKFGWVAFLKCI